LSFCRSENYFYKTRIRPNSIDIYWPIYIYKDQKEAKKDRAKRNNKTEDTAPTQK